VKKRKITVSLSEKDFKEIRQRAFDLEMTNSHWVRLLIFNELSDGFYKKPLELKPNKKHIGINPLVAGEVDPDKVNIPNSCPHHRRA
jgi:hypothetical protein